MFKTSDLGLVAALTTYGIPYLDTDTNDIKKVIFVYEKSPAFDLAVTQYYTDELNVPARTFFSTIKLLKTLIANARGSDIRMGRPDNTQGGK